MKQAVLSCQLNRIVMKVASNLKVIIKLVLWDILVVGLATLMIIL